jgi:hypothetical protein
MIYQVLIVTDTDRVIIEYDNDFEGMVMDILRNEEDAATLTFFWIDQCNFEFSPVLLTFLSERNITLAITTQEG